MNINKGLLSSICKYTCLCTKLDPPSRSSTRSHAKRINLHFKNNGQLSQLKQYIPEKYFKLNTKYLPQSLYLISQEIAKKIVNHVLPTIRDNKNQIICETNAGLGLIASELLDNGVKQVRLYESCPEFRQSLKDFDKVYPGRVELFIKDIFVLSRYAYMDKQDRANRVDLILKNVPKKSWVDDTVMTIIGTMPHMNFLKYLLEVLALQTGLPTYGRIQIFAIMRPRDYAVISAGTQDNLNAYQSFTILFNLFFEYKLLDKFPREMFLPWQSPLKNILKTRYPANLDPHLMYLVQINFKKELPVTFENILPLHYFVKQFYGKGSNRIIPIIEKWVPGTGLNIIIPTLNHGENYYKNMDIFTSFRDLSPLEILGVFKEMINHSAYNESPFKAMLESHLLKNETIETALNPITTQLEKNITEEIEIKFPDK